MRKVTETVVRWLCDHGHSHTSEANAIKCESSRVGIERKNDIVLRIGFRGESQVSVAKSYGLSSSAIAATFYKSVKELYGIDKPDWQYLHKLIRRGVGVHEPLGYVRRKLRRLAPPQSMSWGMRD
jgi:hypothetical protein